MNAYFRPANRVVLSPEGSELLQPRVKLEGVVLRVGEGLVTVKDQNGNEADYFPGFLELDQRPILRSKPASKRPIPKQKRRR